MGDNAAFSPLYVGSVVVTAVGPSNQELGFSFSPLYVGSVVVTQEQNATEYRPTNFQSPIRRVSGCNSFPRMSGARSWTFSPLYVGSVVVTLLRLIPESGRVFGFQSPIRRVSGCNSPGATGLKSEDELSVPYTSGQWL